MDRYAFKVVTYGNCLWCGQELDDDLFFCEKCRTMIANKKENQYIVKSGQKINKNTLYGVIGRKEDKTMMPQTKTCKICGAMMEYQSYASKAADTMFIRYKCVNCGSERKEIALLKMMADNKKILQDLDAQEAKEREFPWPDP